MFLRNVLSPSSGWKTAAVRTSDLPRRYFFGEESLPLLIVTDP
jgi:hypothetical protein